MLKKNISAETVRCSCCPDSLNRIPELDWNVCARRENGIIPCAVKIIVEKRLRYRELTNKASVRERPIYEARKTALKWIGVATFGYLGFNNAKFGRIDAHIGVCAWDRKVLLDAVRVAENRGFRLMHGIVDSLWLKKGGASKEDYEELAREIEAETGFELSFEGIYNWIAFLPSKVNASVPVLNRYFGAYRDGELKVRGIEARRHDTPPIFSRLQMEILTLLSQARNIEEGRRMIPDCIGIFLRYAKAILDQHVPIEEMVFTRNLSKKPDEYKSRTLVSSVANQLVQEEGMELHAGETVRYVITNYYESGSATRSRRRRRRRRAIPFDLIVDHNDGSTRYDAGRYVELLAEACATVLEPFRSDCGAERLMQLVRSELEHRALP
jgi:DNA polymerase-2